ncbi:MAG: glutamine-hydrolyzing carbamoyl-phosphate synthase small subunit, partial [Clostridia bacterium]|nr:glutamine-hydrolyzing carbamoyl-phosphate synthase small subunit [Clostridia bacterium]
MSSKRVYVTLQNGKVFKGYRFGADGDRIGELVFNTCMTGYIETLTDPSNYGQIVAQTFPSIGNYGVISEDFESKSTYLFGYIVREKCDTPSNFRAEKTLEEFMKEQGIVGVYGIDTRELTKIIREAGVMNVAITSKPFNDFEALKAYRVTDAVKNTTSSEVEVYNEGGKYKVALYDLGTRKNIIKELVKRDFEVTTVPAFTTAEEVLALNPDGIVLSEGPGDPEENKALIENVQKLIGKKAIFGISLGHQVLALAMNGKTRKMKCGHRGANQPVRDTQTGRVYISAQTPGSEVVASEVKGEVSFVNVNDGSCAGVNYDEKNAFGIQF